MALIKADRVRESSTTTGTGAFTLSGAESTFRAFSAVCATGDTCYYAIAHRTSNEWETGLGTYSGANTLTRTTVHASSNSGAAVNFSAGTKEVFLTLTAAQLNGILDTSGITDNPPNDGAQYTLACKKTSGTPSFYWVDSTGTIAPKLDLAFSATKSLTPYIGPTPSYSRASTGTYFNSSGVLTSAAINAPRFDHTYNGTSWVSKGLLVEEQRTNSFYYSESASNLGMINASITSNAYTAPDGTQTADAIIPDTGSYNHGAYLYENGDGTNWAVSCFAKASGYRYLSITVGSAASLFDLTDGIYTGTSSGSPLGYGITNAGNGWYRIWVASATTNGSPSEIRFQISNSSSAISPSFSGNNVDGIQIWGMQREKSASFPTSYIKNSGSGSTTRSADVCQITGGDFSGFWNGAEGSFSADFDHLFPASAGTLYPYVYEADGGSSSNRILLFGQTATSKESFYVEGGGVNSAVDNSPFPSAGVQVKVASAYKVNDLASSMNGGAVSTDTSQTLPTVSRLSLGHSAISSGVYLNGHIARLRYYPVRLPNATLQTLST